MKVFPAWMYGDPAVVAERVEITALRAEERKRILEIELEEGLRAVTRMENARLGAITIRLMKRTRIRALVASALKRGAP